MNEGQFIVITGCDGSGKTTITTLIKEKNPNVVILKTPLPPYNNFRERFKGDDAKNTFLTFPYFQDCIRRDLQYINQIKNAGKIVVLERYVETTWAFHLTNCELNKLYPNYDMLDNSIQKPDKTIVLLADNNVRMERIGNRTDRDWWEYPTFQKQYQENLIKTANELSKECKFIDTTNSTIEESYKQILDIILPKPMVISHHNIKLNNTKNVNER